MTDANDIRNEFSPLLDDELSPDARHTVEAELAQDADLLRELDALRKVDNLYRGLPRVSAPDDMAARVRDGLRPKPKVIPLRTRQMSRTVYASLAAAAMFSVLIGGVVLRQEFYVSPSAEDRIAASSRADDDSAAEQASARAESGTLGDANTAAPEAVADGLPAERVGRVQQERFRDDAAQTTSPIRQESNEASVAAEAQSPVADHGMTGLESKDEAQAKPMAQSAAAPPAPPPAPSEAPALGGIAGVAAEAEPPMAVAADTDGADAPSDVAGRALQKSKEASGVKRVADRNFDEREDGWYQRGYNGEPAQVVLRGSESLAGMASEIVNLDDILKLNGDIVFRHGETWYRVRAEANVSP